jgi:hypothetical protein
MNTKAVPDKSWRITKSLSYKTLAAVMIIKAKCYTNFNGRTLQIFEIRPSQAFPV